MPTTSTSLFLGVDIGTFETKGVLVDAVGTVVAEARRPHSLSTPQPGHAEHDAETVWWQGLVEVAGRLMRSPAASAGTIAAVGVSAIGPCILPVDAAFNPLRPAILYGVDTRASAQIDALNARLGADAVFARSGNQLTSQSTGPKILWLKENEPDVYEKAAYFVTSQSFLVARLTGEVVIDHGTAGYFHPLYELATGAWNVEGCDDFISADRLGRLAWATDIAGTVTAAAAAATGIPAGTPVIVGTTDAPAEAISSSAVNNGDMMLMYGSSTYMIQVLDEATPDEVLWSAPFVFPDSYVLAAGTSTAGTLTHWLGDLLGVSTQGAPPAEMFVELVRLAEDSVPGANGLLMLPYFSGERTPLHDPDARGVIAGLTLKHTRSDLARAAMEGIGHSIASALAAYDRLGRTPSRIYAVGGGTKNRLFLQTVSDISGNDQTIAETAGAAFGDAALAAFGVGHLQSRDAIVAWCSTAQTVSPDAASSERLLADHADFEALYDSTKTLIHTRVSKG